MEISSIVLIVLASITIVSALTFCLYRLLGKEKFIKLLKFVFAFNYYYIIKPIWDKIKNKDNKIKEE